MEKAKKIVLFGDSAFAEIAYEYFTHDSPYQVVAFTVDQAYMTKDELFGIPIVPFEDVENTFSPETHDMHIALTYNKLNRIRSAKYEAAKQKGYKLANYISSQAFVWSNVTMGDNLFIFEDNTIQPFVKLGSNIVMWSGNHIGHHSTVGDHNFISSHVVVSGFCHIGESCFLGVNATISNNVEIGKDSLIGAAALIVKSMPAGSFVRGSKSQASEVSTYQKFGINEMA